MKITYNNNFKNNFKTFNETYSISTNYYKIIKTGYIGSTNIIGNLIIYLIIFSLLLLFWIYMAIKNNDIVPIIFIIFISIWIILILISLLGAFLQYKSFKQNKSKKKNTLSIDEFGITDDNNNIKISSNWKDLNYVVIGNYSISVLTTTNIYYEFPIDIKDKLISAINKHNTNKKLKIINK